LIQFYFVVICTL